jgi:hypothetical protein
MAAGVYGDSLFSQTRISCHFANVREPSRTRIDSIERIVLTPPQALPLMIA